MPVKFLWPFRGAASDLRARSSLAVGFPNARGQQSRWFIRLRRPQEPEQPDRPMRLSLPHLTADAGRRAAGLGGATVRHNRRRAGQAQPDGLRSAPALGASAARNPSACSPERATKPGCARTPCRRPRAAFGVGQDHDADRFAKAKEGETTPSYFQSVQPHDLLKPHNAESPVTAQQPRHLHQILCANPLVENQVTGKSHPLGIGKQPAVNEPHHAQLFKSNRQGHQRPSDAA
jgi:hypothetical protein